MPHDLDPDAYQKRQSALRVARAAWHKRFGKQVVFAEAKRLLDEVADHLKAADFKLGAGSLEVTVKDAVLGLDLPGQASLKVQLDKQNISTNQGTTVLTWDPETALFNPDRQWKQYSAVDAIIHVALTDLLHVD